MEAHGTESRIGVLPIQVGSQHRNKAEPAGAVVDGKWVPNKPGSEGLTLTGEPPGPYCRSVGARLDKACIKRER